MEKQNENVNISKSAFKKWLEQLQQESWQLELLISGFALLGILEAKSLVDGFATIHDLGIGQGSAILRMFFSAFRTLIYASWRIFFFNLLIHVIVRGLWIGAIGLRYVSSEIDYDRLNYAENFTRFLKRRVGDFDDFIERLERFASVLFAYTFLLFFIFLSLMLFLVELGVLVVMIGNENPALLGFIMMAFLVLIVILFIDFITTGAIKRVKEKGVARSFFVLYRVFSFLTLSFLYRPLLYNFWDDKYTRRLFFVSIPYIIAILVVPKLSIDTTPFFPIHEHGSLHNRAESEPMSFSSEYYDTERSKIYEQKNVFSSERKIVIRGISLPSIELKGDYAWFFLRSYPSDRAWLEEEEGFTPYRKSGITLNSNDWDIRRDSLYKQLKTNKSDALSVIRKERSSLSRKLRNGEVDQLEPGVQLTDGAYELDKEYYYEKLDSVDTYWEDEMNRFRKEKIKTLHRSLLDLAQINIDNVPFNDSCSCKFYIHPNAGERGLRCYFPTRSLSPGEHLIHLERTFFDDNSEGHNTRDYYVPFYKLSQ